MFGSRKAKKLRRKGESLEAQAFADRTDFQIPDEIQDNLQMAKNEAFGKPALQTYLEEIAAREEASNLSAVNRYATSSADALAAISGVTQNAAQSRTRAAAAGQEVRQENIQNIYQAGRDLAEYKTMQWDLNVNIPFLQRLEFAQALQGAGYQGEINAANAGWQAAFGLAGAGLGILGKGGFGKK